MNKEDTSKRESDQSGMDAAEAAKRIQIGRFFKNALLKKGWTQTELAKAADCTQSMVSKICTGQVMPSRELQQDLLLALEEPLDSIDKLPGLGFDPGSDGFQLKIMIIRALIGGDIPTDGNVDARSFIENDWDYPAFRDATRSSNLDDAVWASLVADHYFRVDEEGRYIPLPLYYDLKGNLLLYVAAMASGMSTVRNIPKDLRRKAIANFDAALKAWRESLDKPDKLAAAIDASSYSLASGDRMMLAALLGHAAALKFFLEVGASLMGGSAEHYSLIVMPFFGAVLDCLEQARNQMVSDTPNPTQGVMASLSARIDEIIAHWKEQQNENSPDSETSDNQE